MIAQRQTGSRSAACSEQPSIDDEASETTLDLERALERTQTWLLGEQKPDGHWAGELEGDTILESDYVLLMAYLGREHEPRCLRLCEYLLEQNRPDGGWAIYPGGPFDLSASVKAYFVLKLTGVSTSHPVMQKAKEAILAEGGAQNCNSFTRFALALLGQIDYKHCPCVPPELTLVPSWLEFSLSAMSAWTRTIVVPLSIISTYKPRRELDPARGIAELFRDDLPLAPRPPRRLVSWENFFMHLDGFMKQLDRFAPRSTRKWGINAAHRWMLDHLENSDGLGAIFPPMIYTVLALDCLGYSRDHHLVQWAHKQLDDLMLDDERGLRIQPCVSPVWDTAITAIALSDAGMPGYHPVLKSAARWLLDREVTQPGDWSNRRRRVQPSGWHFQYRNDFYPDIDDTAMVLLALERAALGDDPAARATVDRAVKWLVAMQNKDGGWAAFDVDIDNQVLTKVPFADHNAMLDPSCADITARVMEILGLRGYRADDPTIQKALAYLWNTQEAEGCWYGRWGVNYIYGTWQVLLGLRAIDFPMNDARVQRAADWLESVQQPNGGWGESCSSYEDSNLKAVGLATPSQTAWAILGLLAAGRANSPAVRRGVRFLVETQEADGTWDESEFTGTGFPKVFYLRYHYYRIYFPLMALGRYRAALAANRPVGATDPLPVVHHVNTGALASRIPAQPLSPPDC